MSKGYDPSLGGALDTNLIAMEILDAGRQSAAKGRTIKLPAAGRP